MRVYVASHCRWAGLHVAKVLEDAGHEITSSWLGQTFHRTAEVAEDERRRIAWQDAEEVRRSEALVLVAKHGDGHGPGGKHVEAGIALGLGLPVVVVGRRENMLLWHPDVEAVATPEEAVEELRWAAASMRTPLPVFEVRGGRLVSATWGVHRTAAWLAQEGG